MPTVNVKVKYSPTGGEPKQISSKSFQVSSKTPTESEVSAAIKKKNPKWNFIILEIK